MAVVVRRLPAALGERDELVAQVDERHPPGSSAQLEVEEAAVERKRLLDVAHLESDVVHAQQAWAVRHPGSVGRDWPKAPETLDVSFLRIS
jgi:hypothetical protein